MKSGVLFFVLFVSSVHSLAITTTAILDSDSQIAIIKNADDSQGAVLKTTYLRKAIHANAFCRGSNPPNGSFIRTESGDVIQLDCSPQYSFIECDSSEKTDCLVLNKEGVPASVIATAMQSFRKQTATEAILSFAAGESTPEWVQSMGTTRKYLHEYGANLKDLMSKKADFKFEVATINAKQKGADIFKMILHYGAGITAEKAPEKAAKKAEDKTKALSVEKKWD